MGWFLRTGDRLFCHSGWHRAAFGPILYCFLWGATVRIWLDDSKPPIPFKERLPGWTEPAWTVLSLMCPPMILLAWWLILHSRRPGAAWSGMWIRLAADTGQLMAVLAYHLATVHESIDESRIYSRYVVAAVLAFLLLAVVRDVWSIMLTRRLAGTLNGQR